MSVLYDIILSSMRACECVRVCVCVLLIVRAQSPYFHSHTTGLHHVETVPRGSVREKKGRKQFTTPSVPTARVKHLVLRTTRWKKKKNTNHSVGYTTQSNAIIWLDNDTPHIHRKHHGNRDSISPRIKLRENFFFSVNCLAKLASVTRRSALGHLRRQGEINHET